MNTYPTAADQISQGTFDVKEATSDSALDYYRENGWVHIENLFDLKEGLFLKVHEEINSLIDIQIGRQKQENPPASNNSNAFIRRDDFVKVAKSNRNKAGDIYRACRHLPSLHRLSLQEEIMQIAGKLMMTDLINHLGYAAVRIDIPGEEKYLFPWHQDYPYTQGSIDGIVIWIPFFDVPLGHGHLKVIPHSHKKGIRNVKMVDPENKNKNGAHVISLIGQEELDQEPSLEISVSQGDALVFSTLLLHKSTPSEASLPRFTAQLRYANFRNIDSINRGWPNGALLGNSFEKDHSEYISK